MNLKEELRQLSNKYDGISYDRIVEILKEVAKKGERYKEFQRKDISENTVKQLRKEGLNVKIIYITDELGENYESNCYSVSW